MVPMQVALQTNLKRRINRVVSEFLTGHPHAEQSTVENALRDALADAPTVFKEAKE